MEIEIHSTEDLNKLCRFCLNTPMVLYSIYDLTSFDENGYNIQLIQLIMECTSVKVQEKDSLPKTICGDCLNNLESFYNFKQQCKKSEKQLYELVDTLKSIEQSNSYILFKNNIYEHSSLSKELIPETKIEEIELDDKETFNLGEFGIKLEPEDEDALYVHLELQDDNHNGYKLNENGCVLCSKKFNKRRDLINHEAHCKFKCFSCDVCYNNFNDLSNLYNHILNEHSSGESRIKLYNCDICDETYTDRDKLLFHFHKHIILAEYFRGCLTDDMRCHICFEKLSISYKKWFIHMSKHKFLIPAIDCNFCSDVLSNGKEFEGHMKQHGIDMYICNVCLISFDSIKIFKQHFDTHINKTVVNIRNSFTCPLCMNSFQTKLELKEHLLFHFSYSYTCTLCLEKFESLPHLSTHFKAHENPTTIICSVCGKLIPKGSIFHHLEYHSHVFKHICSICNKAYRNKTFLKVHLLAHNNEKPFICTRCSYTARTKNDLSIHMRIHTGEKPYLCKFPYCNQRFKTASHRMEHMRRHTDERRFKCQICNKAFGVKSSLKYHMLSHLDLRPHNCNHCEKKFRRKHHLLVHERQIHGK